MSLVDLWPQLTPKRTRNGEWCGPCPRCGGKDRFLVWPEEDQYWCRQCHAKGDSIQFLRDYRGLSYQDAARMVGKTIDAPTTAPDPRHTVLTHIEEQLDLLFEEYRHLLMDQASMRQCPDGWGIDNKLEHYRRRIAVERLREQVQALLDRLFPPEEMHVTG